MTQPAEKRKAVRRMLSYPAWINLGNGSPPQECALCDTSDRGAQLTVADAKQVPDNFVLALSADGAASRRCHVVWRVGNQVGVEFLKTGAKKNGLKAPRRMRPAAPVADRDEDPAHPIDVETLPAR